MSLVNQPVYAPEVEVETTTSGVAWTAIIGGAFAMIGISLILIPLGMAFGLASFSPWSQDAGVSKALSETGAIWLIFGQWISSGFGGYLTGRLRTKWAGAHTHEVFFRDTTHGFLSWTLAAVFSVLVLVSMEAHFMGHMGRNGEDSGRDRVSRETFYTDNLLNSSQGGADISESERRQVAYILAEDVMSKEGIPVEDRTYLTQLVSSRTGLALPDAEARVNEIIDRQKKTIDVMRKRAAEFSLMICLSMLMGAFIASAAAALGGRDRDIHYTTGQLVAITTRG